MLRIALKLEGEESMKRSLSIKSSCSRLHCWSEVSQSQQPNVLFHSTEQGSRFQSLMATATWLALNQLVPVMQPISVCLRTQVTSISRRTHPIQPSFIRAVEVSLRQLMATNSTSSSLPALWI